MSKLNDILEFVKTRQTTLNLSVAGTVLTIVKRKLPKREETVDSPYMTTISGAEVVAEVKRIAFKGKYLVPYVVEITLVTPNDKDELINLTDHATWLETTRGAYQVDLMMVAVGSIYKVEVIQNPFLDRAQIKDGYDYTQVVLRVTTHETRLPAGP